MTKDKELIERLAQKAWHDTAELIPQCDHHIHSAKAFLAAYLAERGKEAVAWAIMHDGKCMGFVPTQEAGCVPVFLATHPAIPEGMADPQAKITEQAAEIELYRAEMSAARAAGFYSAQELYMAYTNQAAEIERWKQSANEAATATIRQAFCIHECAAHIGPETSATIDGLPKAVKQQAERIKALEAELSGYVEDQKEQLQIQVDQHKEIIALHDKLAKADAVIEKLKETCSSGIWSAGSDFVAMTVWRLKEALAAIEQYQEGE